MCLSPFISVARVYAYVAASERGTPGPLHLPEHAYFFSYGWVSDFEELPLGIRVRHASAAPTRLVTWQALQGNWQEMT